MHFTSVLVGLLAASANALPGRDSHRRDAQSSPSSSSAAPASTTSSTAASLPPFEILCTDAGKNQSTWEQFGIGLYLGYLANKYSPYDTDFSTTLAKDSEGVYDWNCEIDVECDWKITGDSCSANSENPRKYFILTAVQHFHNWIQSVLDSIQQSQIDFSLESMKLTQTFVHHELESGPESWLPSVFSGMLGSLSAIAGPFKPALSTGLGIGGGVAGTGGGIVSATIESGAEVVQESLDKMSDMQEAIANTTTILRDAVKQFGESVINETPRDNSASYAYGSDEEALPKLLQHGEFAEKVKASDQDELDKSLSTSIFAAAISSLWYQESGFVVNVSRSVYDIDPCTYDTDFLRECVDDRAYIFMRDDNDEPTLKGTDELDKYNLGAKELAESSGYIQSKKGYDASWEADEIADEVSSGSVPYNIFANLPVCNLDDLYAVWLSEDDAAHIVVGAIRSELREDDHWVWLIARNACPKQWINGQKWPLAKDGNAVVTTSVPAAASSSAAADGVSLSVSPAPTHVGFGLE